MEILVLWLSTLPPEVSHPSLQKYELKEARSKEDIVSYEELGVWKDTGMYEYFSNGETRYQEVGKTLVCTSTFPKENSLPRSREDTGMYE